MSPRHKHKNLLADLGKINPNDLERCLVAWVIFWSKQMPLMNISFSQKGYRNNVQTNDEKLRCGINYFHK